MHIGVAHPLSSSALMVLVSVREVRFGPLLRMNELFTVTALQTGDSAECSRGAGICIMAKLEGRMGTGRGDISSVIFREIT